MSITTVPPGKFGYVHTTMYDKLKNIHALYPKENFNNRMSNLYYTYSTDLHINHKYKLH